MNGLRRWWLPGMALVWVVLGLGGPLWGQATGKKIRNFAESFGQDSQEPIVTVKAQFTAPTSDKPGRLFITAKMKAGWHIYSITQVVQDIGPKPTTIRVEDSADYRLDGKFLANPAAGKKKEKVWGDLVVETHEGEVVWYAPVEFRPGFDPAGLKIKGAVKAQPCSDSACMPPQEFSFAASVGPGITFSDPGPSGAVEELTPPSTQLPFDVSGNDELKDTSTLVAMLLGFAGGLILNIMPCVLPVIGLKLFSFMEQAGHSRREGLILNIWYSSGLIAVFLVLAALSVLMGLGWGQLFSYKGFTITMATVVFAMGLSFLGVWEIPIPGFVGRGKANEWAEKEGASGAFAKGVFTTLLATPCSGPFLASALAWTVNQPPVRVFAVFISMGLGMASPYLLIGAFPQLIRFLPKPGAWMETFRQFMGFVLLGTVVFVLTFIPATDVVPTVALLFGVWFACWWIGRTPLTADLQTKLRAWAAGAAITGAVWLVAFGGLLGTKAELPWRPYTPQTFQELVNAKKPVMVDFTADWCLTCKTLEAAVLNTSEVRDAVEANGVVPLKADWTHGDKDVTEMLERLGSKQVPVLAFFPAGNANKPIRLLGGYTRQAVLDALNQAAAAQ